MRRMIVALVAAVLAPAAVAQNTVKVGVVTFLSGPAASPFGMTWMGMSACSSRCTGMPRRISSMNHRWNSGPVSSAPPPSRSAPPARGPRRRRVLPDGARILA